MATTTQPSTAPRNLIGIDDFMHGPIEVCAPMRASDSSSAYSISPRVNLDILVADGRANRAVGARCDLARRRGTRGGRRGGVTVALAGVWLGARLLGAGWA